jgi:hypothetical protein
MSDDVHARDEPVSQRHSQIDTNARRSIAGGVKGTIRFFAPSVVVGLLAPFLFPAMRRAARPVAKGVLKGALILGESIKEGAAGAREQITDLLAEVKAEREQEAAAESTAANKHDA